MAKANTILNAGEFPQLSEMKNEQHLTEKLQQYIFPNERRALLRCKIKRVYYKPGKDCRLLFIAAIFNPATEMEIEQLYFGKMFLKKNAGDEYKKAANKTLLTPVCGAALTLIPEWNLLLWAFPNDPDLPGITMLADDEAVLSAARKCPADFGLAAAPVSVQRELKKHVPGKRCCFTYDVAINNSAETSRFFGKVYNKSQSAAKAYHILKALCESDACRQNRLRVPQLYSFDRERDIIWKETLTGKPLAKMSDNVDMFPELAKEIGRQLAVLHGLKLDLPVEMPIGFQLEELAETAEKVHKTLPQYRQICEESVTTLMEMAAHLPKLDLVPIHASFKLSHIFWNGEEIAIIDFDGANLGDPGYDLGRFAARLYRMQVDGKIAPALAEQTIQNFFEAYNQSAIQPVSSQRTAWFTAGHLIISEVHHALKRVRLPDVDQFFAMVQRMIAVGKRRPEKLENIG